MKTSPINQKTNINSLPRGLDPAARVVTKRKSASRPNASSSNKAQFDSMPNTGSNEPRANLVPNMKSTRHHFRTRFIFARHFRANSYVPLLLALRPRAGSTEKSVRADNLDMTKSVQYTGQKWHFHQFCPLRWTKCKFLSQFKDRRSSLVERSSAPLVSSLSVLTLSLIFISSLFGSVVFPTSASAANLTLTIPSSALVVKATPNQFSKSEAQRISVSTDSVGGYTLKLSSKHGNTLNNTSNGGASKINPITSELTEAEFSALGSGGSSGGGSGGSGNINVWGFKPSKLNGLDNSSLDTGKFIAAPTMDAPITLDTTSVANSGTANEYDITLGVKVDSTLPAGSYSNTFVLTATVNALKYDITYDAGNAEGNATNMPTEHDTGETSSTSVTLTNTIPEWSGYVFQGWCTVKPEMKSGRDDCENTTDASSGKQGVMYRSGAEFPLTMASTTTTLYAMWNELLLTDVIEPEVGKSITFRAGEGIELVMVASSKQEVQQPPLNPEQTTTTKWWPFYAIKDTSVTMAAPEAGEKFLITVVPQKNNKFTKWQKNETGTEWTAIGETGSYKTMQDLTQAECTAAGESGMNVTDTRNNVSYTVGIISNGNDFSRCWMYSNLRLEGGTSLTPDNSDVNEATNVADAVVAASNWVNYWSKKEMIECKGKAGESVTPFESDGNKDQNRFCADNSTTVTEYYYNWYAAIANDAEGNTPTSGGSGEEGSVENAGLDQQAKGSICPKNWRLMEEDTPGDGRLITKHDEIDAFVNAQKADQENWPGRLATSGNFFSSQQHNIGLYGTWWSASRHSDTYGRDLVLNDGGAFLNDPHKNDGKSVRCILRG